METKDMINIERATNELATVAANHGQVTVADVVARLRLKQEIYDKVMLKDTHYGVIPGCPKPSLYKPGAEILGVTFGLAAEYSSARIDTLENGHREVTITCRIKNEAGRVIAECSGSCSTLEGKYRWRDAKRHCPSCSKTTIIKGKKEYGGGWLCFAKHGGCGAKYNDGDQAIEGQEIGKIENPDMADQYNTVLKMAQKRAYVGAMLAATAASDIFTQDVEDMPAEYFEGKAQAVAPRAVRAEAASSGSKTTPSKSLLEAIKDGTAYEYNISKLVAEVQDQDTLAELKGKLKAAEVSMSSDKSRAYTLRPVSELTNYLMNDVEQPPVDDDAPDWMEIEPPAVSEDEAKEQLKAIKAKKGGK